VFVAPEGSTYPKLKQLDDPLERVPISHSFDGRGASAAWALEQTDMIKKVRPTRRDEERRCINIGQPCHLPTNIHDNGTE